MGTFIVPLILALPLGLMFTIYEANRVLAGRNYKMRRIPYGSGRYSIPTLIVFFILSTDVIYFISLIPFLIWG